MVFSYSVNEIEANQQIQAKLLAKKQYSLNELRDAIADQRKYSILFEQERQMNIILKTTIQNILEKVELVCNINSGIR